MLPDRSLCPDLWSLVVGVAQPATVCKFSPPSPLVPGPGPGPGPGPVVFDALGLGQPLTSATVFLLLSELPAGLYVSVPGEPAIGVGQPAGAA
jgi:hypothetical protein